MDRRLILKLHKIESEMLSISDYCKQLETSYNILTDQYMNGDILNPIGKKQRQISREIEKYKKKYYKLSEQAFKIKQKLQ